VAPIAARPGARDDVEIANLDERRSSRVQWCLATVDGYFQTMTTVLICATRRIKPSLEQKNGLHLHLHVLSR
jgi:hypothetical protein